MKIDALFSQNQPTGGAGGSLLIQPEGDFSRTLTLGQIIKGRVLRSYEGSRYLMDFGGREHVVDSTIPLRRGEIVHGRVVALGERVELRRIAADPALSQAQEEDSSTASVTSRPDRWTKLVQELFERYQARLGIEDQALLRQALPRSAEPGQLALSALILTKLGLRLTPELLQAVFLTLMAKPGRSLFPSGELALQLNTAPARGESANERHDTLTALAAALQAAIMPVPDLLRPPKSAAALTLADADGGSAQDQRRDQGSDPHHYAAWSRRVLNAQTGGAVAHRLSSIPLLVNGRLVELDVALFEQRHGDTPGGLTHRQILFSLTTEHLGTVEVKATLAGEHVRVALSTASSDRTLYLSAHAAALREDLQATGWQVDELVYLTQEGEEGAPASAVMRGVAEHIISPGSVSRWV